MKHILFLLSIATIFSCSAPKTYQVHFKVDMSTAERADKVYVQGDLSPLSWNQGYELADADGDGTYEAKIEFVTKSKRLKYKFRNGDNWELQGADNRTLWFKPDGVEVNAPFNEYETYSEAKIQSLTYSPEQIKEDVAALKETIKYVHPSLYKYRSATKLETDFQELEAAMLAEPNLTNAYKQVSKFATKIQCSHTFTNPWNQGGTVEKAIFFSRDKVPFTFDRIGRQLFIARNASDQDALVPGREILAIDGVPTTEILNRLLPYISGDGANEEKKLQRLTLGGTNKFELFDIFFSLEFGTKDAFQLTLKDHVSGDIIEVSVKAMSKTARDAKLRARYTDFNNDFASGWQFEMKNDSTAYLKMRSFAAYNKDFNWRNFLDSAFREINEKNAKHLILDIRGNEGGETEIVEHLLRKVLQSPITVPAAKTVVNYKRLPEELEANVSTWSKLPYNWGATVEPLPNGQYLMKERYSGRAQTYEPAKNNFQGQTYLLIDAENSSATQIMATYAKRYKLATLIGQETGGNQRGLNGGYIFFLRLPNTKVEVDLPLLSINLFPVTKDTPNGGIQPDVFVQKNVADFVNGVDTELSRTMELIQENYAND